MTTLLQITVLVMSIATCSGDDYYGLDNTTAYDENYYTNDYGNTVSYDEDIIDGDFDVAYTSDYGDNYGVPPGPPPPPTPSSLKLLIDPYKPALIKLFNSSTLADSRVFNLLYPESYWNLQRVEFGLNLTMNHEGLSHLTPSEVSEVQKAGQIIRKRMMEIFENNPKQWLIQSMNEQRHHLASAYSHETTFSHFHDVMASVEKQWDCKNGILLKIWREIVSANDSVSPIQDETQTTKTFSLQDTMLALVKVAKAAARSLYKDPPPETYDDTDQTVKAKLITDLSTRKNKNFIVRVLGQQKLESWIEEILCNELSLNVLEMILLDLSNCSVKVLSSPDDLRALMDIQHRICQVTSMLKDSSDLYRESGNIAHNMLGNYMDLVDHTVHATGAWGQMSYDGATDELHKLLLNTEQYVGVVSDVTMAQTKEIKIDKSSLTLMMSKISDHEKDHAHFKFDDAKIEVDDPAELKDMKVYALRYKSWSDIFRDILKEQDKIEEWLHLNKSFVSKGGVISFSARNSTGKQSVPVTFWIKFGPEINSTVKNPRHGFDGPQALEHSYQCLSCEFLDRETTKWEKGGCEAISVADGGVRCHCNHTTNFAAFMMPAQITYKTTESERKILFIMETVGSWLSVIGLICALIVFGLVRNVIRNERLKAHIHLSIALLIVHIVHLLGGIFTTHDSMCLLATLLSHYFLLATFMWMLVEGIFLYIYVVQVFLRSSFDSYRWMYLIGWFIPALIVSVSAGYGIPNNIYINSKTQIDTHTAEHMHNCPRGTILYPPLPSNHYGEPVYESCWLNIESGMQWSFLGPALIVLTFNIIILFKTLQVCRKTLNSDKHPESQRSMLARNSPVALAVRRANAECFRDDTTYDNLHGEVFEVKGTPEAVKPPPILVYASNSLLQVTTSSEEDVNDYSSRRHTMGGNKKQRKQFSSSSSLNSYRTESISSPLSKNFFNYTTSPSTDSLLNTRDARLLSTNDANTFSSRYSSVSTSDPVTRAPTSSINYRMSTSTPTGNRRTIVVPPGKYQGDVRNIAKDVKTTVKGAVILLPVLGVPWVCGVLTHLSIVFSFVFVILNTAQGLAIFVVYCVMNGEVRRALERRLAVSKSRRSLRRTSSTSSVRSRIALRFGRRRSTVFTSAGTNAFS